MAKQKLGLTPEHYALIDKIVGLKAGEYYTVVTHRVRGKFRRSIHVFARQPNTAEMMAFEDTSSKVKVRGRKTEFEGSQLLAYKHLYDLLISRAYDVADGFTIHGELPEGITTYDPTLGLDRQRAKELVPMVTKREALRDSVGEVYSEGRISELEGEDDEVTGVGAPPTED